MPDARRGPLELFAAAVAADDGPQARADFRLGRDDPLFRAGLIAQLLVDQAIERLPPQLLHGLGADVLVKRLERDEAPQGDVEAIARDRRAVDARDDARRRGPRLCRRRMRRDGA